MVNGPKGRRHGRGPHQSKKKINGASAWRGDTGPRRGDTVTVEWRLTDNTTKPFTGQVVKTTPLTFTVKYEDNTPFRHVQGTPLVYDFSVEGGCLSLAQQWAAGKRVPMVGGALDELEALYLRLAGCADKTKMFPGWRRVRNKFWSVWETCVAKS
jgi:hypothetical protein